MAGRLPPPGTTRWDMSAMPDWQFYGWDSADEYNRANFARAYPGRPYPDGQGGGGQYGNPMPPFGGGNPYMNPWQMPYGKGGGGGWGNPDLAQGGFWTPNLGIGPDGKRLPPVWHGPPQWAGGDGPGSPGYGGHQVQGWKPPPWHPDFKGKPQGRGGPDSGPTYPGAQPGPGGPMALPGQAVNLNDWHPGYWDKEPRPVPPGATPNRLGPQGGQNSPRYGGPSYGPQMGQAEGVTTGGFGGAQPGPVGGPIVDFVDYMGWGGPGSQVSGPTGQQVQGPSAPTQNQTAINQASPGLSPWALAFGPSINR